MKPILDPMCGPKMFYFDKDNANVLFGDIRWETHWTRQYKNLKFTRQVDGRQEARVSGQLVLSRRARSSAPNQLRKNV